MKKSQNYFEVNMHSMEKLWCSQTANRLINWTKFFET